jgi:hypothetical protein
MTRFLTVLGFLAAAVLIVASATMNFTFTRSMGRTPVEGLILGLVAVGVDVLKAILALRIAEALRDRRWSMAVIGTATFVLFSTLSLATAFGFAASNRDAVLGAKSRSSQRLATLAMQLDGLRRMRDALPPHRLAALIDEELTMSQRDPRWLTSRQCSLASARALRDFCDGISRLRLERIAALEANRLEQIIAANESEADSLRQVGGGMPSDPQASALGEALGLTEAQVRRGLAALLAIVVEIGSGLGLFFAHQRPAKPVHEQARSPHDGVDSETSAVVEAGPTAVTPEASCAIAEESVQRAVVVVRPRKAPSPRVRPDRPGSQGKPIAERGIDP